MNKKRNLGQQIMHKTRNKQQNTTPKRKRKRKSYRVMRKNKFLKYKLKSTTRHSHGITRRSSKIVLPTNFHFLFFLGGGGDNEEKLPKHSEPQDYIVGTGKSRTIELSHTQAPGHSRDLNLWHQCREHTYLPVEATPGNTLPTHMV